MTVLYSVSTGSTVLAADLNQYKSMLEGASGYTSTYKFRATAGSDIVFVLGDNAAANKFSIHDSDNVEVWKIDSNGGMTAGALSPTSLVVPNSGAPAQTASGSAVWDTVNETLTVANGTVRRTLTPDDQVVKYKSATQVFTTDTTYADITATSGNFAFPVLANARYKARFVLPLVFGGTGGVKLQLTGPAAPTLVRIDAVSSSTWVAQSNDTVASGETSVLATAPFWAATAFSSGSGLNSVSGAPSSGTSGSNILNAGGTTIIVDVFIVNGANAGTVTLQGAQNSSNSTTTFSIGCYMIAERLV